MVERRPPEGDEGGHSFDVRLTSQVEEPIRVTARHTEALAPRKSVLLHPSTGKRYDLDDSETATFQPDDGTPGFGEFDEPLVDRSLWRALSTGALADVLPSVLGNGLDGLRPG
jgi:hypothetical protein